MQSKATTVPAYLEELPVDRREAIQQMRELIFKHLPKGYEEQMQYGMIGYVVPLKIFPEGYLGRKDEPLPFLGLASQKNHLALYLMTVYADPQKFKAEYAKSGKRLDMGKSCIRFKKVDDLALDVIGREIGRVSMQNYIEIYKMRKNAL